MLKVARVNNKAATQAEVSLEARVSVNAGEAIEATRLRSPGEGHVLFQHSDLSNLLDKASLSKKARKRYFAVSAEGHIFF